MEKTIDQLLKESGRAVCGISEREVVVPRKKLAPTIKNLKKSGFYVIGTSYGPGPKKVWFTRPGAL